VDILRDMTMDGPDGGGRMSPDSALYGRGILIGRAVLSTSLVYGPCLVCLLTRRRWRRRSCGRSSKKACWRISILIIWDPDKRKS
jgi:hypothetical protein